MPSQETITVSLDSRQAEEGVKHLNTGIGDLEKGAVAGVGNMDKAFQGFGTTVINVNNRMNTFHQTYSRGAAEMVSESKAVHAVLGEMEHGFQNNGRAAAAFIEKILGAGPAMQAIFPIAGAAAFIGVVVEVGQKLYEMFAKAQEAHDKLVASFQDLDSSFAKTNIDLELTNVKLANQIAKLEHKPQNLVLEALLETKKAADDLAESLENDSKKVTELLKKNEHGWFSSTFGTGGEYSADLTQQNEKYERDLAHIRAQASMGEITPKEEEDQLAKAVTDRRAYVQAQLRADRVRAHEARNQPRWKWGLGGSYNPQSYDDRITEEEGMLGALGSDATKITDTEINAKLKGQLPGAQAAAVVSDRMAQRQKELDEAKAMAGQVNQSPVLAAQRELAKIKVDDLAMEREDAKLHSNKLDALDKEIARQKELNAGVKVALVAKHEMEETQKAWDAFERQTAGEQGKRQLSMAEQLLTKSQLKEWGEGFAADDSIRNMGVNAARQQITSQSSHALRMAQMQPGMKPQDAITLAYQERISLAQQLYDFEMKAASDEENVAKRRELEAHAFYDQQKAQDEAHLEMVEKQAELQHQEFQKIKGEAENLFHTAFTNPKGFSKQFTTTIRNAALHPLEDRLSTMVAGPLQQMFGQHKTVDGTASAPYHVIVQNMPGGGTSASGGGSIPLPHGGSISLANLPSVNRGMGLPGMLDYSPASHSVVQSFGSGTSDGISYSPANYSPASYSPMDSARPVTPSFNGNSVFSPNLVKSVRGLLAPDPRIVGYGPDGTPHDDKGNPIPGLLGGLKNGLGGLTRNDDGKISGVNGLAGAAMTGGGMMLAQHGLMGPDAGTGAGVFEGALGGAAAGFAMGGPLGAAIGGAAGFLAGVGEVIAGVESKPHEAVRLIQSTYGIRIPMNSPTIQQVVQIAQSKFGGSVSTAVRSEDVRQILQLYSQASGQKSATLTASTIHSASLIQSGGTLSQQATYVGGTPWTYASAAGLPVSGPGAGNQVATSNPFYGPVTVSVSPGATQDLWAKGTAAAIVGNPNMISDAATSGDYATSNRLDSASTLMDPWLLPV